MVTDISLKKRKKMRASATNNESKSEVNSSEIETNASSVVHDTHNTEEQEKGKFENFMISKKTVKKLKAMGVEYLFPVQSQTFNDIFNGKDMIVKSRTGTGKTIAFMLPLVEKLLKIESDQKEPKVLVLAPTRELAKQTTDTVSNLSNKLSAVSVYGGTHASKQVAAIQQGADIIVGTPGRLKDLIENEQLDISKVQHVVLDECDRMLDMGFLQDVEEILGHVFTDDRPKAQTLIFSATVPKWVRQAAKKYLNDDHLLVDLVGDDEIKTSCTVEHLAIECHYKERPNTISNILRVYSGSHKQAIVFCETKKEADELSTSSAMNLECHVLHGDIPQDKRELVLQGFRDGKYRVLVTTDVAARGLDIPDVELVVITSPPQDTDDYIHRSGRTGRAGKVGTCICLYKPNQAKDLSEIENKTGITFKRVPPPSTDKLVSASASDAVKSLLNVTEDVRKQFSTAATEVLAAMTAEDAISAALAVISGCTKVAKLSLLSGKENFTTYVLTVHDEHRGVGLLFSILRKAFGDDFDARGKVGKIMFTSDKKNAYFELISDLDEHIQSYWKDSPRMQMFLAEEIPDGLVASSDLFPRTFNDSSSRGGGSGRGGRGSRGGFRGGRGGGGRGGRGGGYSNGFTPNKRFNDSSINGGSFESSNKKIKFDDSDDE